MVPEKKLILMVLLFLVTASILDSWRNPNLKFWNPGVWSYLKWNLTTIASVVLAKKLFEVV